MPRDPRKSTPINSGPAASVKWTSPTRYCVTSQHHHHLHLLHLRGMIVPPSRQSRTERNRHPCSMYTRPKVSLLSGTDISPLQPTIFPIHVGTDFRHLWRGAVGDRGSPAGMRSENTFCATDFKGHVSSWIEVSLPAQYWPAGFDLDAYGGLFTAPDSFLCSAYPSLQRTPPSSQRQS